MNNYDKNNNLIFGTSNSTKLAELISNLTEIPLATMTKTVFSDGEILVSSNKVVRNIHTYVVFSGSSPVNDNLMELFLFIDSLKRASAKSITVVMTYFPYARQDRKTKGRECIGAKIVADFLEKAGANKIIAIDLHNSSLQGFFNIPTDDLRGQFILAESLKKYKDNFMVVSPDHGGAVRARFLAEILSNTIQIAIVDKRRTGTNISEIHGILGDVKDKNIVIIDDIIDTGGTIINAAKKLKEYGAKKIIIAATHGIFSQGFQMFEDCDSIDKVIVTNSVVTIYNFQKFSKLYIACLSPFLSKVILANVQHESISELYLKFKSDIQNGNE